MFETATPIRTHLLKKTFKHLTLSPAPYKKQAPLWTAQLIHYRQIFLTLSLMDFVYAYGLYRCFTQKVGHRCIVDSDLLVR